MQQQPWGPPARITPQALGEEAEAGRETGVRTGDQWAMVGGIPVFVDSQVLQKYFASFDELLFVSTGMVLCCLIAFI